MSSNVVIWCLRTKVWQLVQEPPGYLCSHKGIEEIWRDYAFGRSLLCRFGYWFFFRFDGFPNYKLTHNADYYCESTASISQSSCAFFFIVNTSWQGLLSSHTGAWLILQSSHLQNYSNLFQIVWGCLRHISKIHGPSNLCFILKVFSGQNCDQDGTMFNWLQTQKAKCDTGMELNWLIGKMSRCRLNLIDLTEGVAWCYWCLAVEVQIHLSPPSARPLPTQMVRPWLDFRRQGLVESVGHMTWLSHGRLALWRNIYRWSSRRLRAMWTHWIVAKDVVLPEVQKIIMQKYTEYEIWNIHIHSYSNIHSIHHVTIHVTSDVFLQESTWTQRQDLREESNGSESPVPDRNKLSNLWNKLWLNMAINNKTQQDCLIISYDILS